jgi:hypothetical protein
LQSCFFFFLGIMKIDRKAASSELVALFSATAQTGTVQNFDVIHTVSYMLRLLSIKPACAAKRCSVQMKLPSQASVMAVVMYTGGSSHLTVSCREQMLGPNSSTSIGWSHNIEVQTTTLSGYERLAQQFALYSRHLQDTPRFLGENRRGDIRPVGQHASHVTAHTLLDSKHQQAAKLLVRSTLPPSHSLPVVPSGHSAKKVPFSRYLIREMPSYAALCVMRSLQAGTNMENVDRE